jgi:polyisoprenoid-binding protein YceI
LARACGDPYPAQGLGDRKVFEEKFMRKMLAVLPLLFVTTLAQAEPVEWSFDGSHSKIGFKVQHLVVSNVSGRFKEVEKSKIVIDDQNPANDKIEIEIKAASINTDEAKGYKVTGNLTIRDVTKEVVLTTTLSQPIKNPWGKQVRAATLTGTINRGDFGLKWNKALEAGGVVVGDKVTLEIDAEVTR